MPMWFTQARRPAVANAGGTHAARLTELASMTGRTDQLDETVLLSVLSDLEGGDFTVRMPIGWTGVAGKIAEPLNNVIAANETLGSELAEVSRVVGKEGKLSRRLVLRGSDRVWHGVRDRSTA
jgi:hypothetical protein